MKKFNHSTAVYIVSMLELHKKQTHEEHSRRASSCYVGRDRIRVSTRAVEGGGYINQIGEKARGIVGRIAKAYQKIRQRNP